MSFKHKFMCLLALTEEHKINILIVDFGLLCTFVIGNGRTVSVTLLLVTLLHSLSWYRYQIPVLKMMSILPQQLPEFLEEFYCTLL
jgi:Flp pilus assembly protein TadB